MSRPDQDSKLAKKPDDAAGTLRRLWQALAGQRWRLLGATGLIAGASLAQIAGPWLLGEAIDAMIGPGQVDFRMLAVYVGALTVSYVLASIAIWLQIRLMIGISQQTVKKLRQELFAKVQALPLKFFDRQPHGELMSRLTNDVENISNTLTQSGPQLITSFLMIIGLLVVMLLLNSWLTLVTLLIVPLGLLITRIIAGRTRKFFSAQQKRLGELNGYIEEMISGQRVIKAFSHEEKAIRDFCGINQQLNRTGIKAQIFSGLIGPLMNVVNNFSFVLVGTAGAVMAIQGMISIGMIAAFTQYARQFTRPISDIANQFNMIQVALAGAERVFEIMDEKEEFADDVDVKSIGDVAGHVEFSSVHFAYEPDQPVLKDIWLKADPGQTIALIGPTGAGKTTVINLLTRFYDVDQGRITIDGHDIRSVTKEKLRSSLGIVLQDSYLFADTVRENIRYGRLDASDEEVEQAAVLANADLFIRRLTNGYDTVLSDAAANLSQGQQQLLTIARAVLANPAILILDEATSSVDTRTEQHIQQAMLKLMEGRTSFVIAHRLSTIRKADVILVIDGGRIVERGNHDQLLEHKGMYFDLYNSQFQRGNSINSK